MASNNTIDKISIRNGNEANSFDTRDIGAAAKNVTVVFDSSGNILVNGMEGEDGVASTKTLAALLADLKKADTQNANQAAANGEELTNLKAEVAANKTELANVKQTGVENQAAITVINQWKTETQDKIDNLETEVFESPIFVVDPVNYGTTLPNQGNVEGRVFFLIEEGQ